MSTKKSLSILVALTLLLGAGILAITASQIRAAIAENATQQEETRQSAKPSLIPEDAEESFEPTLTPTPITTPEPAPEPTPGPTLEPTPTPSPAPTPKVTPAPAPAPIITKNPTTETAVSGNTIYFIAKADNASTMTWFIASPDGNEGVNAEDISSKFPNVSCTGQGSEMLGIANVDPAMDGWKVVCKFSGPGGETFTEPAYITVHTGGQACRTMDEVLVLVLNARDPNWLMAQGLAYALTTGSIADYFYDSGITAEEVKNAVTTFTQNLSDEHRIAYKERADLVISFYSGMKSHPDQSNYYLGLFESGGYEPQHFPWDDERIGACIDALGIT